MKESKSDKTVIAFLIFPTKTNSFNVESLRGCAVAKGMLKITSFRPDDSKLSLKSCVQKDFYRHFKLLIVLGLKDTIDEIQRDIGQRMYETCLRGNLPDAKDLLSRDDMVKLKRCIFAQGKW